MQILLSISTGLNFLLILLTIKIVMRSFVNIFLLALLGIVFIGSLYVLTLPYFKLSDFFISNIINSLPTLVGSLTYLYVYFSINRTKKFQFIHLIHFAPLLIALPLSFYDDDQVNVLSVIYNIGLKIVISIVYFVFSIHLIRNHQKVVLDHYSNRENIDLKWLDFVVKIGLFSYGVYLTGMILWLMNLDWFSEIGYYSNLLILVFIFSISYYGISATSVFDKEKSLDLTEESTDTTIVEQVKKELIDASEAKRIFEELVELIETKELFRNENLLLEDLASELGIHSKYVSYVINSVTGTTFFDLINKYRVQAFNVEVLKPSNKDFTFLTIAYGCGFGSKSAFNRIYKQQMGVSPSVFFKNNSNN